MAQKLYAYNNFFLKNKSPANATPSSSRAVAPTGIRAESQTGPQWLNLTFKLSDFFIKLNSNNTLSSLTIQFHLLWFIRLLYKHQVHMVEEILNYEFLSIFPF